MCRKTLAVENFIIYNHINSSLQYQQQKNETDIEELADTYISFFYKIFGFFNTLESAFLIGLKLYKRQVLLSLNRRMPYIYA